MDLLKKIEVQIFSFVVLFCFCFCFLFNGHNADIQSLHKISGCESKREAPRGNPRGSAAETAFRLHAALVSFLSSLSSRKKKVDPNDFSPCIKQKTIITVEFIFF